MTTSEIQEAGRELLTVVADTLGACRRALTDGGATVPGVVAAERAKEAFQQLAEADLRRRVGTVADLAATRRAVGGMLAVAELARATVLAAVHTRVVYGIPPEADSTVPNSVLVATLAVGVPPLQKWVRRARRNLTFHSVHLRNSLRLATSLAVARLAVGVFDLSHGFWVLFATLVVVRTSSAGTRATAVGVAVGTAIGFVVSTAFVLVRGHPHRPRTAWSSRSSSSPPSTCPLP